MADGVHQCKRPGWSIYVARNLIERAFRRLKDWRRIATRYDKLAINFESAVAIAAVILWWT